MAYKPNTKNQPVSWIISQNKKGNLNKNISIQRKEVWGIVQKSNWILTLIKDVPCEGPLLEEAENDTYLLLDGKQRILTICSFIEDGFALSPKMLDKEFRGTVLVDKKFSELPEDIQSRILECSIPITIVNPLTDEERDELFYLRNQAASLTTMDLLPSLIGDSVMKNFDELCQHKFITNKIKPSPAAIKNRDDLKFLLHYLVLCSNNKSGLSGESLLDLGDDIRSGKVIINKNDIISILDYLDLALSSKRAYFKTIFTPIILYLAKLAIEKGINADLFGSRLDDFFLTTALYDEKFKDACKGRSADRTTIQTRLSIMSKILDDGYDDKHGH